MKVCAKTATEIQSTDRLWFNIPDLLLDPTQLPMILNSGFDESFRIGHKKVCQLKTREPERMPGSALGLRGCLERIRCLLGVRIQLGPVYLDRLGVEWYLLPTSSGSLDWMISTMGFTRLIQEGRVSESWRSLDESLRACWRLNLWTGLKSQDGTEYLTDGVVATDVQVWYLPQLLEGMEGQSVSE